MVSLGPSPITETKDIVEKNPLSKINESIMRCSSLKWELSEIYILAVKGIELNYRHIHAPANNLDPNAWDTDIGVQLKKEKSNSVIISENWRYCAQNNIKYLWPSDDWLTVLHKRENIDFKFKHRQMVLDLLWILRNNPINSPSYFLHINDYYKIPLDIESINFHINRFKTLKKQIISGEVMFQAYP